MIKPIKDKPKKIVLDLTGPDGNAFVILGHARHLAKQLGLDWNLIRDEMTSADYDHLLNVMEKYFGNYIIMYK